jgi:hypothetical protein
MSKLNTFVSVDGTWYGPDSDVPDEVAAKITNPKAWAEAPSAPEEDADDHGDPAGGTDVARPRGNASRDDWAAYATGRGVEFDEQASQREIRAAVEAADAASEG